MPTRSYRVTAPDGTFLGYQATGDGEPLVLVHGASSDARQWARLVPLVAQRFTVMAMDRRGRGASGPVGPHHSLEVEYGDVAAVACSVATPVHLFGHSSGARYALHAAARIANLASLMLYDPPDSEYLPDRLLAGLADLEASGDREGILRTFFVDAVGMDDRDFAALKERPIWPLMTDNALTVPAELRAARRYRFDPSELAGLNVPTMLLLGESSGPELRGVVERIADALPRAEVVVLAGQGHGAMVSAPGLLASRIVRFVDGLRP